MYQQQLAREVALEIRSKETETNMDTPVPTCKVSGWILSSEILQVAIPWLTSYSLKQSLGSVGDNSCYEYSSCYQKGKFTNLQTFTSKRHKTYGRNCLFLSAGQNIKFDVGNNSCQGQTTCSYSGEWVTIFLVCIMWCLGNFVLTSCCNALLLANTAGTLTIGNDSCNGYYGCYKMPCELSW